MLTAGVLAGVVIGIILSLGWLVYINSRPPLRELARRPGTTTFRALEDFPDYDTYPHLLIIRFDGGMYFVTTEVFVDQLRERLEGADPPIDRVVIDFESVNFLDSQGSSELDRLVEAAHDRGILLHFARLKTSVRTVLDADEVIDRLGADRVHTSVDDAVNSALAEQPFDLKRRGPPDRPNRLRGSAMAHRIQNHPFRATGPRPTRRTFESASRCPLETRGALMNQYLTLGVTGLLSLAALSACGSDDTSTTDDVREANATFCADLTQYASAIEAFIALDPAVATKSDVESAAAAVESARESLSSSAADLGEAQRDNLEAQADDLANALDDAADDETVAEIVAEAQAQATEVRASVATLDTAVCTSSGTTATTGG